METLIRTGGHTLFIETDSSLQIEEAITRLLLLPKSGLKDALLITKRKLDEEKYCDSGNDWRMLSAFTNSGLDGIVECLYVPVLP